MTMREWLNAILALIGSESLTDEEYDGINFLHLVNGTYDQESYDQLAAVLEARESVSTVQARLVAFYLVKGTEVTPLVTAKSNIYIGDVL